MQHEESVGADVPINAKCHQADTQARPQPNRATNHIALETLVGSVRGGVSWLTRRLTSTAAHECQLKSLPLICFMSTGFVCMVACTRYENKASLALSSDQLFF